MTDLKECQENFQKCINWANDALDVRAQNSYFEMAKAWLNLAEHIECAQAREHDKLVPFPHRDVDSRGDDRPDRRNSYNRAAVVVPVRGSSGASPKGA